MTASGSIEGRKNEMAKGREKSDGPAKPQGRRKAAVTAAGRPSARTSERGGKGTTASKQVEQLGLFRETADSPKGVDGGAAAGRPATAPRAMPKSRTTKGTAPPAMTMEEVASEQNLREAFREVASNKGAPGPDKQSIDEVRKHLETLLPELSRQLLEGSYQPGMIRRVWIPKPGGGGQRGLGIPDVVDRIVGQAIYRILSPNYEPTFHDSSHGFRPGRSCHTAIAEAKTYVDEGYDWLVDLDLEKFFDRVCHQRLLARLGQQVEDQRLIVLIRRMLKAKVVMPDGVVVNSDEGVPQGGPLSPLLSNIVLDELDRELEQRGHRFVRYADDCNIYVRSERSGQRVMASVTRFIERRLRLKVNQEKSAVARPEKRHFVGFSLRREPQDGTVEVLLSERSKRRLAGKVRELTPRNWGRSLRDCISQVNEYLRGWLGFFLICSEVELRTLHNTDAHVRRRLRAIVLAHWKRRRYIARRLIRLGVRPATAWRNIYEGHKSLWALSHCPATDRGLDRAWFACKGLLSLEQQWQERQVAVVIAQAQLELGFG
jgi:RNA-directed DNA polymerase